MKRRRLATAAVIPVLVGGALSGCVTIALDRGAFVQNGKSALESATSETASAQLAVTARLGGDATRAYADTVITESEGALAPIEASFGAVDPPSPAEDDLRGQILAVLGDADDALASARVAIRRDDPSDLGTAGEDLAKARAGLEKLRGSLG